MLRALENVYSERELKDVTFTPVCNVLYFVLPNHPVRSWDGKELRTSPYTDGKLPVMEFDKPARL